MVAGAVLGGGRGIGRFTVNPLSLQPGKFALSERDDNSLAPVSAS